ncbi:MAG TPA: PaaI family thioesterase [Verrucomicrobiae bacterium]|jgi:acyl-coenzyme A thioesterase PaaI-like protein|nr:PaaI family thioesterase [Verrucomicrobiae bacterium]
MANVVKLDPKPTNRCFGCGAANTAGMKLAFELDLDARRSRGSFVLGPNYAGGGGFAHGGIIAVVLDEAMGKLSRLADESAVTAEMNIEYKKPVPIDKPIFVEGWQEDTKGRNRFRVAEIHDQHGNLLARGKGRFVIVQHSHFTEAQAAQTNS